MKLWIARDKDGLIGLYDKKPNWRKSECRQIEDWYDGDFLCCLDRNEFPELAFENSPQEVELKLAKQLSK